MHLFVRLLEKKAHDPFTGHIGSKLTCLLMKSLLSVPWASMTYHNKHTISISVSVKQKTNLIQSLAKPTSSPKVCFNQMSVKISYLTTSVLFYFFFFTNCNMINEWIYQCVILTPEKSVTFQRTLSFSPRAQADIKLSKSWWMEINYGPSFLTL